MADTLKDRVVKALTDHAAPALELDGTVMEVLDVTDGVVRLRLNGACAGCPATVMTLITGLEHEVRSHVPEIEYLEAVP